ncbi:DUF6233 domain-containing protein [Streptomyces sp. NPDC046831]|uniref:DUF6233 domain-containing protein n=1 Tax=Streptomyces sp. NPDC046831 TaxID=3154805 RepID=UPI00340D858F
MWLARIDRKIAALKERQAEEERGRRLRPRPPEWLVELGIGSGRRPLQVHTGDCHLAGERRRPVSRDEARRLLATGLTACGHCRPDARLSILELEARRRRARAGRAAPSVLSCRRTPSAVLTDRGVAEGRTGRLPRCDGPARDTAVHPGGSAVLLMCGAPPRRRRPRLVSVRAPGEGQPGPGTRRGSARRVRGAAPARRPARCRGAGGGRAAR